MNALTAGSVSSSSCSSAAVRAARKLHNRRGDGVNANARDRRSATAASTARMSEQREWQRSKTTTAAIGSACLAPYAQELYETQAGACTETLEKFWRNSGAARALRQKVQICGLKTLNLKQFD